MGAREGRQPYPGIGDQGYAGDHGLDKGNKAELEEAGGLRVEKGVQGKTGSPGLDMWTKG